MSLNLESLNLDLVADINPGAPTSDPDELIVLFGELYFRADNGTSGDELFKYDPLADEVSLVADINPGGNSSPDDLTVFNGKLYFEADNGPSGNELFVYDPLTDEVSLVADINPGGANSSPRDFTVYDGELYFSANNGTGIGRELFKYDPDTNTVTLVADINPGAPGSSPREFAVYNGELYFSAITGATGRELFKYNSDTNAVTLVADIDPGAASSFPTDLTVYNGELYFAADNGTGIGDELYRYNSETNAITLVGDINPGAGGSFAADLTVLKGELFFSADNGTNGDELFKYNSETNVLTLAADINPGAADSLPTDLTVFRGELFFAADNGENGDEVYKYNPETEEATLAFNVNASGDSFPNDFAVLNGDLYFEADEGIGIGDELYTLAPDPFDGRFGPAERAPIGDNGDNFTPVNGGWTSQDQYPRTLADVNGDGLADIVAFGQTSVFVSYSEGDGSFSDVETVLEAFTPDNGGWTSQDEFPRTAADVNGDGRADLVGFGADSVFVSLSQADGSFGSVEAVDVGGAGESNFTVNNGGWTSQDEFPRMFGDFNGDGLSDIIGFGNTDVFVSLSEFDGETVSFGAVTSVLESLTPGNGGWTSQDEFPRMVGDFDGDDRDDIIGFGANDVFISFSNGDGTFTNAAAADIGGEGSSNFTVNNGGWTSQDEFPRIVADIDGDNRDDIIGFGQNEIFYALSEGDGSFTEAEVLTLDGVNSFTVGSGGWTSQDFLPRFLDDINGDDQADIVGFGSESVFTALA